MHFSTQYYRYLAVLSHLFPFCLLQCEHTGSTDILIIPQSSIVLLVLSIKQYAKSILKIITPNKKIKIKFDRTKPNGTPRKVMDISLAKKYGWKPVNKLEDSILKTYRSFLKEKRHKKN